MAGINDRTVLSKYSLSPQPPQCWSLASNLSPALNCYAVKNSCWIRVKVSSAEFLGSDWIRLDQIGSDWIRLDQIVPAGSPSRGRDATVYVLDVNQPSLPTLFLFCSCACFCPYGPFHCISFHKFSRQLNSAFSLCSSGLNSAFLVLSTTYLFMKVSLSPDIILCDWLGWKAPII